MFRNVRKVFLRYWQRETATSTQETLNRISQFQFFFFGKKATSLACRAKPKTSGTRRESLSRANVYQLVVVYFEMAAPKLIDDSQWRFHSAATYPFSAICIIKSDTFLSELVSFFIAERVYVHVKSPVHATQLALARLRRRYLGWRPL